MREHIQADNLLLRSYIILFGDITVQGKTPSGIRGNLVVDFATMQILCDELIAEAKESVTVRQEAEAQVLWAKFAAIECGVLGAVSVSEERNP